MSPPALVAALVIGALASLPVAAGGQPMPATMVRVGTSFCNDQVVTTQIYARPSEQPPSSVGSWSDLHVVFLNRGRAASLFLFNASGGPPLVKNIDQGQSLDLVVQMQPNSNASYVSLRIACVSS